MIITIFCFTISVNALRFKVLLNKQKKEESFFVCLFVFPDESPTHTSADCNCSVMTSDSANFLSVRGRHVRRFKEEQRWRTTKAKGIQRAQLAWR